MLGVKEPLKWKFDGNAMVISLPEQLPGEHAWVLKIEGKSKADELKTNTAKN
jgi:hypothetical protein